MVRLSVEVRNVNATQIPNYASTDARRRPKCANSTCKNVLVNCTSLTHASFISQLFKNIVGTSTYYHPECCPGQTFGELIRGGIASTYDGIKQAVRRHPYITAAAVGAIGAFAHYLYSTSETYSTLCYHDKLDRDISWCAEVASKADPATAVFRQFEAVKDWAQSNVIGRSFDQVKNGDAFTIKTVTKYFVQSPVDYFKSFLLK